jgi:hypothetical protein
VPAFHDITRAFSRAVNQGRDVAVSGPATGVDVTREGRLGGMPSTADPVIVTAWGCWGI